MPHIVLTTELSAPPERCFGLSLSVDAHLASMAASGEEVVGGVTSGEMRLGDSVTWRARHFALWFTMISVITECDSPRLFVDEQMSGPFASWRHEHRFEPAEAGTLMTDVVDFESPLGPLGRVANGLVLTRYMTRLLEQRNTWLARAVIHPTPGE